MVTGGGIMAAAGGGNIVAIWQQSKGQEPNVTAGDSNVADTL